MILTPETAPPIFAHHIEDDDIWTNGDIEHLVACIAEDVRVVRDGEPEVTLQAGRPNSGQLLTVQGDYLGSRFFLTETATNESRKISQQDVGAMIVDYLYPTQFAVPEQNQAMHFILGEKILHKVWFEQLDGTLLAPVAIV